jgi:hypothetical protein
VNGPFDKPDTLGEREVFEGLRCEVRVIEDLDAVEILGGSGGARATGETELRRGGSEGSGNKIGPGGCRGGA